MNNFMKKAGIASVLVVALALVVIVTGAFAQGPDGPATANGSGQMRQGNEAVTGLGAMAVDEADMHAAIAGVLGMTLVDFEAAVAKGQTPYSLAADRNIDFVEIQAVMADMHAEALEQAAAEGLIPQGAGNMGQGTGNMGQGAGNMAQGAGNMAQSSANQGGAGGDCLLDTP